MALLVLELVLAAAAVMRRCRVEWWVGGRQWCAGGGGLGCGEGVTFAVFAIALPHRGTS